MAGKDIPPGSENNQDDEREGAGGQRDSDAGPEAARDSDPGSSDDGPGGSAPEVDVEIVDEGGAPKSAAETSISAAESANAAEIDPDMDDGGDNGSGNGDNNGGENTAAPEKVSGPVGAMASAGFQLSPGLILFFAFVVLAVVITAIWAGQRKGASLETAPGAEIDAAPSSQTAAEQDAQGITDGAPEDGERPAESVAAEDKIANSGFTSAKDAMDEVDLGAGANQTDDGATINQLPPAPPMSESANSKLQNAAKAAAQAFAPVAGETLPDGEIGSRPESETVDPPVIEFNLDGEVNTDSAGEGEEGQAVDPGAAIEALQREARDASADDDELFKVRQDDGGDQNKIANDIASLKQEFAAQTQELKDALAEERQRSERQATQIAMLRESLERTLAERDAQQENVQPPDARREAAALALFALQRVADRGEGFTNELATLRDINSGARELPVLEAYADAGAPTIAALSASFGSAAEKALAASMKAKATGPMSRIFANLGAAVSVRPATPQAGDRPAAIISRAEARLENGDLPAALTQLDALEGPAAEAFSPWLDVARRRANIDAAIDALGASLLRDHLTQ